VGWPTAAFFAASVINRAFDGDGFAAGHTLGTDQELLKFS
jgi:hypothetical protein